jgi:two-component system chemotaxis sensor kinase CheA
LGEQVSVLRLGDGDSEIAYAIDRILDTVELTGDVAAARRTGEVEGTTLIDGLPTEVLDTHWLFACFAAPPRALDPPVCRLPSDDHWAHTILAPLVEAAGYRVVDHSFEGAADVVIATEGGEASSSGGTVITLCSDPQRAGQVPGSLYRYDRAGLAAALAALRTGRAA